MLESLDATVTSEPPRGTGVVTAGVRAIVEAARARKATDVRVLDVGSVAAFTDYFVIASGSSVRQVQAIADAILDAARAAGHRAHHVEGLTVGEWVLIDCADVVVHVFTGEKRRMYDLERLWNDAVVVDVPDKAE